MRPATVLTALLAVFVFTAAARAQDYSKTSTGQLLFVPAYAHVYHGSHQKPYYLTVILSLHNTDPEHSITITNINYYSTSGELLSSHAKEPKTLGPLATLEVVIPEKSEATGSGDNFLVLWQSEQPVSPPLAEAVMIGTASGQGVSFVSRGVVIQE